MKARPPLRESSGRAPQTRPRRDAAPPIGRFTAAVLADVARQTRLVDPEIAARWRSIAGPELAEISRPGRLTGGPGPRTFEVVVSSGAAAAMVEMAAPALVAALNAWFGPGAVGRVCAVQTGKPPAPGGLGRFRRGG